MEENRSLKRHYGQRYPMPHRLCLMLWYRGNGAAAPEGQMTYDSTQGNFSGGSQSLTLAQLDWIGLMGLDLGPRGPDLGL